MPTPIDVDLNSSHKHRVEGRERAPGKNDCAEEHRFFQDGSDAKQEKGPEVNGQSTVEHGATGCWSLHGAWKPS